MDGTSSEVQIKGVVGELVEDENDETKCKEGGKYEQSKNGVARVRTGDLQCVRLTW